MNSAILYRKKQLVFSYIINEKLRFCKDIPNNFKTKKPPIDKVWETVFLYFTITLNGLKTNSFFQFVFLLFITLTNTLAAMFCHILESRMDSKIIAANNQGINLFNDL